MSRLTSQSPCGTARALMLASTCLAFMGCAQSEQRPTTPNSAAHQGVSTTAPAAGRTLPVTVTGTLLQPLPRGLTSFGAAALDNEVYVIGGYFGQPHNYSHAGQSVDFFRFDTATGALDALSPMPQGRQSLTLTAVNGRLYRAGGMVAKNDPDEPADLHSLPEFMRYDADDATWVALPSMPSPRSSHDAVAIGQDLYVVGGWQMSGGPGNARWHDTMVIYNTAEARWRSIPAPFRRRALAVAALGEDLVAIGGMTEDRKVSAEVDIFDRRTESWRKGPSFPGSAFGVAATSVNGTVFASGQDGVMYRLDPNASSWVEAGTLAFNRFFHQLVAADGKLVALGGINGMAPDARSRHVELFDAKTGTTPIDRVTVMDLPNPGPAKNRQGIFLYEDTLYAFGGNNSVGQHDFEKENFVSTGWSLHLPTLTTREMPAYPVARQTMATVVNGHLGYSLGGFGHDGESAKSHDDIYVFDFKRQSWASRKHKLPEARTQFGVTTDDQRLFVFGGLNYDDTRPTDDHFRHEDSVLVTSVEGDAPFETASIRLPAPRRAFASARLGHRFYIVGGMRDGFEFMDDVLAYDFELESWIALPKPKSTRLNAQLVAHKGRLYLAGGAIKTPDGVASDRSIEVFDPEQNEWRTLIEAVPFETRHMRMMSYGHRLLIYTAHDATADRIRLAFVNVDGP